MVTNLKMARVLRKCHLISFNQWEYPVILHILTQIPLLSFKVRVWVWRIQLWEL